VVLRPALPAKLADAVWLTGGLLALGAAEMVSGLELATWWPDSLVDAEDQELVAKVRSEALMGPGRVRAAVVGMRFDLVRLALSPGDEESLLGEIIASVATLGPGPDPPAAAYTARCAQIGRRVRVGLRPRGETRGVARRVDEGARLEVSSSTGMLEQVSIDMLRSLEIA
jgi:hypothetical protein